jgi:hypothetical protein
VFAEALGRIDAGDDCGLAGCALGAAANAQVDINRDEFGIPGRKASCCRYGPVTVQELRKCGKCIRSSQRIDGCVVCAQTNTVQKEKQNAPANLSC